MFVYVKVNLYIKNRQDPLNWTFEIMIFDDMSPKVTRDLNLNLPFSNWHFGLGLFDP